jgi:hypothetical protein
MTYLAEDEDDAAEETDGPSQLLLPRKELERLCRSDDERQSSQEEDLYGACPAEKGKGRRIGEKSRVSCCCLMLLLARFRSDARLGVEAHTFPRARRAPSKNMTTPRSMKNMPKEDRPTPISTKGKKKRSSAHQSRYEWDERRCVLCRSVNHMMMRMRISKASRQEQMVVPRFK